MKRLLQSWVTVLFLIAQKPNKMFLKRHTLLYSHHRAAATRLEMLKRLGPKDVRSQWQLVFLSLPQLMPSLLLNTHPSGSDTSTRAVSPGFAHKHHPVTLIFISCNDAEF